MGDAHHGHLTRECRIGREGMHMQARDHGRIGIAGPAATAFGKQHHGQLLLQRDAQHAVGLGVISRPLGAGQHRGVIGHDHGARPLRAELGCIDGAHARHHAVGRRVGHQIVEAAPACLRGNRQRPVFDEAACIAEIGDILTRAAAALGMAPGHGPWPRRIEREAMAIPDALQIVPDVARVLQLRLHLGMRRLALCGREHQQGLVLRHIAAGLCQQLQDMACGLGQQHMLHLHGFEHAQLGALGHRLAHGHGPLHDPGWHGGQHSIFRSLLRLMHLDFSIKSI